MTVVLNKEDSTCGSFGKTTDFYVSSSTSVDTSPCSVQDVAGEMEVTGSHQVVDVEASTVKVSITVISLDGVVAKKYQPKSKLSSKQKKKSKNFISPLANIVASFSQNYLSKEKKFFTHVHLPSLPIDITSSNESNPIIQWPNARGSPDEKQMLSTIRMTREKTKDDDESSCPIDISISRHGKLINLGKANLVINGTEKSDSTINIPIVSTYEKFKAKKNSVKKVKGNKKSYTPMMMRIKGDSLQFGLKNDATLQVMVSVDDVGDVCADGREKETLSDDELVTKEVDEVVLGSVDYDETSWLKNFNNDSVNDDCECVFDDDSIEQDDYEDYIKAANESNELRSLKQQLRNSDDVIKNLKVELDKARKTAEVENDKLRAELKQATQNSETLLQELNQSKSESEIVPFLEARINEFLEELKKKDSEIECLRDEVMEIRNYYKHQVNALLWDNQDNTKTTNWKAAIGSAALKVTKHIRERESGDNVSANEEEKKIDETSITIEEPTDTLLRDFHKDSNESDPKASNWRTAIGSAALKARKHIYERDFRDRESREDRDGGGEIFDTEKKNGDTMKTATEENTHDEKDDRCDKTTGDNNNDIKDNQNNIGKAANWKITIGSAFRKDNCVERETLDEDETSSTKVANAVGNVMFI